MNRLFCPLFTLTMCCLATSAIAAPPITTVAFTPDGKQVLLGSQAGLQLRDWPALKVASEVKTEVPQIHDLAFSPDGKTLLVAGGSPAEEGGVEIWTWPGQEPVRRITAHTDVVYRVAWSPDGREFATASGDGTCQIFAAETGNVKLKYVGHSRAVLAIGYLNQGNLIASAGVDQTLQVWDAGSGELVRKLDNHLAAINDLAVRPPIDAKASPIVATASDDRTVRFWQPTIGRLMRFAKSDSAPRAIAWTADGKRLVAACTDGTVRVIDPETAEVLTEENAISGRLHALALTKDSMGIVAGESGIAKTLQSLTSEK